MQALKSKPLQEVLASAVAEQKRCARQQQLARQLVKQAQQAVRDSQRLHRRHVRRDARQALRSR